MTSVYQSMLNGGPYRAPDPECLARSEIIAEKLKLFNETPLSDQGARQAILKAMLLSYEPGFIAGTIALEYGHLELGAGVFINKECLFMDDARITIRKNTMIGPRCIFITPSHSLDPMQRMQFDEQGMSSGGVGFTAPILIEEHVWLAANVTVLPGVTIGARSTIGTGSVVTKNIPADVLAFGNPCRVHRNLKVQ